MARGSHSSAKLEVPVAHAGPCCGGRVGHLTWPSLPQLLARSSCVRSPRLPVHGRIQHSCQPAPVGACVSSWRNCGTTRAATAHPMASSMTAASCSSLSHLDRSPAALPSHGTHPFNSAPRAGRGLCASGAATVLHQAPGALWRALDAAVVHAEPPTGRHSGRQEPGGRIPQVTWREQETTPQIEVGALF